MGNLAAAVLTGILIFTSLPSASFAQTGAAYGNDQRRYRDSISGVLSADGDVFQAGCVSWFPGVSYVWQLNRDLSRGDINNAPEMLTGHAVTDGIRFETYPPTNSTFYGELDFGRVTDGSGCVIGWNRSDYRSSEVIDGIEYRFVLNWRNDGRIAGRYLRRSEGETTELARYVYEKYHEFSYSQELVDARVENIDRQAAQAPSGFYERTPQRRRRQ